MNHRLAAATARLGLTCLLMLNCTAQAGELTVLSGNGARAAVTELAAQFERASGHKVTVHFDVNPDVKRKVEAGAAFDVLVLNPPVLDELIRQGHVLPVTRAMIGRAGIGAAVRAGTPLPDISTVEAFRRTLLGVRSVAYPGEGASGKYFVSVVERLGITDQMRTTMRPMPAEYNVEVVARGEVDLVVVVASRVAGVAGVTLIGPIPQELPTWIGFAAGVGSRANAPDAARALVRFLTAPAAAPVLRSLGVEPFVE